MKLIIKAEVTGALSKKSFEISPFLSIIILSIESISTKWTFARQTSLFLRRFEMTKQFLISNVFITFEFDS